VNSPRKETNVLGMNKMREFRAEKLRRSAADGFARATKDPSEDPCELLQIMLQINSRTPLFPSENAVLA
jgi:hypothetical protein